VLLVLSLEAQETRALKVIYKTRLCDEELEILRFESEILQRLSIKQLKSNVVLSYQVSLFT
jgi:hypothetical protein